MLQFISFEFILLCLISSIFCSVSLKSALKVLIFIARSICAYTLSIVSVRSMLVSSMLTFGSIMPLNSYFCQSSSLNALSSSPKLILLSFLFQAICLGRTLASVFPLEQTTLSMSWLTFARTALASPWLCLPSIGLYTFMHRCYQRCPHTFR